jgi:hypothetical protein
VHESGAIELGGHKVLSLAQENGKLTASAVERCAQGYWQDDNREHMVMPGLVYLSQPTEYGTLYSLSELEAIRAVCDRYSLSLYLDGARLAYALSCPENDVTLESLARLCDAFYIGGTKCGALFGEAVVFPQHERVPHFFTIVKQHGALLAKGRIAGLQFDTLFTDGLYERLGRHAVTTADRLRAEEANLKAFMRAEAVEIVSDGADRAMPGTLTKLGTVYLSLEGLIDKAAEAKRVAAELEKTRGFIKSIDAKLSNENFVAHAPAAIVEGQKTKRAELVENVARLEKLAKLFA